MIHSHAPRVQPVVAESVADRHRGETCEWSSSAYEACCGELLLGGYSQSAPTLQVGSVYLLPDRPKLEEVADRTFADQTYDNYKVHWPDPLHRGLRTQNWTSLRYRFQFTPADSPRPQAAWRSRTHSRLGNMRGTSSC